MKKGLKLTDILVTIVISLVFGVIYKLWSPVYSAVKPIGLHVDQLLYGMWFLAGPLAFLIIRKPGVALLAETAASSGELLMGSEWGLSTLIYGLIQGLLAELILALFRYKKANVLVVSLAAIASCAGSIVFDYFQGYIDALVWWNLGLFFIARFVGSVLIAGVIAYGLAKALEKTGVTGLVRGSTEEDVRSLDD
ncbi:ECF transporter S component [Baia soyae]|uniref:Energy-coupling factor transport system substrate-specific component n=1 Tax=Baia soyae TaxID=1544746 RepID=A0A4R2S396_9BACL|nr:ECF transporter S component [Baia soyae]TCP70394.1 energy-coupling factor transport system substrate-specific component [Baia soyae]